MRDYRSHHRAIDILTAHAASSLNASSPRPHPASHQQLRTPLNGANLLPVQLSPGAYSVSSSAGITYYVQGDLRDALLGSVIGGCATPSALQTSYHDKGLTLTAIETLAHIAFPCRDVVMVLQAAGRQGSPVCARTAGVRYGLLLDN